jgi:ribosomal protein S12 methylthiotransferase accessory factor
LPAADPTSRPAAVTDESEGLDRLRTLVSQYTGVVSHVHEVLLEPDDARNIRFDVELASTALTTGPSVQPPAGGSGHDRRLALAAALGEAVERYSGTCLPPESQSVLATASELGPAAVEPERFALFSEAQYAERGFPFRPFTTDTTVRWVKGRSIPDGAEAYLPLQLAYIWRGAELGAGETPIAPASSSGMAAGATEQDAILHGLHELIERDAVMLTWANRLALPRLDWSMDAELVEHDVAHFASSGIAYEVIDLSVFCEVPTALALTREGAAGFGAGAASAATMQRAWDKALRECFQVRTALKRDLLEDPHPSFQPDFSDIDGFVDHVRFYSSPEQQVHTEFLTSSEQLREIGDVPALEGDDSATRVEAIARRLEARNVSAYWVDIAPPDVKEAGLHAVHVISPDLQPINDAHRYRFLGGSRLHEAAAELGLRDAPLSPDELNPYPHPFA